VDEQGQYTFEFHNSTDGAKGEGEARSVADEGPDRFTASKLTEPKSAGLMEQVVEKINLKKAYRRVVSNKGGPGIDGMRVEQLGGYLRAHWPRLKEELLAGRYQPSEVKRVEIPKPRGGVRQLGVPTVVDRFIQQAILQVLSPIFEPTFSEQSYGFRPGRRAHQAVKVAQQYLQEGYRWVVDIDIEKFFDRVNHDVLMGRIAKRIDDKRFMRLLRRYLQAGVMVNGVVIERYKGTPQGGPLSPLLSNVLLDELDKELQTRGHRFVRYADDCNIYVKSSKAGERVMESLKKFLARRLRLSINESKSAVGLFWERKFLGLSFYEDQGVKIRIAPESIEELKGQIRRITRRNRGISLAQMIGQLNRYFIGWIGYFRISQGRYVLGRIDQWTRRRLRCFRLKQWKNRGRIRFRELTRLGLNKDQAATLAGSRRGCWVLSGLPQLQEAMPSQYFQRQGLVSLYQRHLELQSS
jgi:group II intron reverse transcriptase/maturase